MQTIIELIKRRKRFNYKSGDTFGRLTLTGLTYTKKIYNHWVRFVEAVCVCGEVKEYVFSKIASGETQSCGCLRKDVSRKRMTTHNLSNHPLYLVYKEMIKRCYEETNHAFKNYGGRGIEVWKDWKDDFVCFYDWAIENGYKEGLSLDREDNDGNYAPYNCRWTTVEIQSRNRRTNRMFTAFGETKCLFDWGKDSRCVVTAFGLRSRVDKGWDIEKAMTEPLADRKKVSRSMKSTKQLTAFGETKCMSAWVEDKRCVVGMDRLRDRVAEGWDHLEAITKVHKDERAVFLTAFGETKNIKEWLADERCVVKYDAIIGRYKKGWKHEDCLTIPSRTGTKKENNKEQGLEVSK